MFINQVKRPHVSNIEWKISDSLVEYPEALNFMENRVNKIALNQDPEMVWLLEHPPIYTKGTSAKDSDLRDANKFPVFDAGRGGEITYHGPGQLVAYVMLNLKNRSKKPDVRKYVYDLEQWIINSLERLGINGERRDGRVGIWVQEGKKESKIAAIGVRVRKWITFHGISINISPDMEHYNGIVPCGINEHGITSIQKLKKDINVNIKDILKEEFEKIF